MPGREKRSKRLKRQPEEIRPVPVAHVKHGQQVRTRVRCPVCGMNPTPDVLDRSPFPLLIRSQVFGGSLPGGKGLMNYIEITDKAILEEWRQRWIIILEQALEMLRR